MTFLFTITAGIIINALSPTVREWFQKIISSSAKQHKIILLNQSNFSTKNTYHSPSMKKIPWLILGAIGLFFLVAFLYQKLINSFSELAKKDPIGFFEVDFKIVGVITLLLILIGVSSLLSKDNR
ncbi:MAG: hypothetical protein HRT61_08260 [Ekhidna sp.]|nr:hypothetical protein [Ekhidna sp.]